MTPPPVLVPFPERQRHVHEMIQQVGGYWRPIAGVARLLEELGELTEQLAGAQPATNPRLAEELADLWIITTCTANQFQVSLPAHPTALDPAEREPLHSLVTCAGQLARIVNYYDGPKNPRSVEDWPTLGAAISGVHASLYRLADDYRIRLDEAIDAKIARTARRDVGRFRASYDPSTAETLGSFEQVRATSRCSFASSARLWGAPTWRAEESTARNVERIVPFFTVFAKAAEHEGLDGFLIANPADFGGLDALAGWFHGLLCAIARHDHSPADPYGPEIERPEWQFSFYRIRMFVTVFSSVYPATHVRHAPTGTFVLFQPEESFTAHGVGGGSDRSHRTKRQIRDRFGQAEWYPTEIIDARIEALIYVLPVRPDDPVVRWWRADPEPVSGASGKRSDGPDASRPGRPLSRGTRLRSLIRRRRVR